VQNVKFSAVFALLFFAYVLEKKFQSRRTDFPGPLLASVPKVELVPFCGKLHLRRHLHLPCTTSLHFKQLILSVLLSILRVLEPVIKFQIEMVCILYPS